MRYSGVIVSEEFARHIHGPIGLDIGGETPEEIALAIMAEILAVLNARNAKPVRDRSAPLHVPQSAIAYA